MTFFYGKDHDDQVCKWVECNDTKCTKEGLHYHSTTITVCIPQKNTLDAWAGTTPSLDKKYPKLSANEIESLKPVYKQKGLGKVPRVYTNWRRDPYKK